MGIFRKKINFFYIPGLFSLVAFPLIFSFYYIKWYADNDERVLPFNMPPKDYFKDEQFKKSHDELAKFTYKEIRLKKSIDKKEEVKFFQLLKEFKRKNIPYTGIKFQLNESNSYNDLLRLLNMMEMFEFGRYMWSLEDDSFYVYADPPTEPSGFSCGTSYSCGLAYYKEKNESTWLEDLDNFVKKVPNSGYLIFMGYFSLWLPFIFEKRKSLK